MDKKYTLVDLEEAIRFGVWSVSGPTNAKEAVEVERWADEAWEDFKKQRLEL